MKKRKKRFNFKRFLIFILLIVIIYYLLLTAFNINTKNIIILGNEYYSDEVIIETASIENYPKFIMMNISKIKKKLLSLELVESVEIKKNYDFTLEIKIKEKNILYEIRSNNKYKLSDNSIVELKNISGIPMVINYIPDDIESNFVKKFNEITSDVRRKISEIEYSSTQYDEERFLLYMNDGNQVYITLTKIESLNKYIEIVKKLEGKKGILYLDSGNYFEIKKN